MQSWCICCKWYLRMSSRTSILTDPHLCLLFFLSESTRFKLKLKFFDPQKLKTLWDSLEVLMEQKALMYLGSDTCSASSSWADAVTKWRFNGQFCTTIVCYIFFCEKWRYSVNVQIIVLRVYIERDICVLKRDSI